MIVLTLLCLAFAAGMTIPRLAMLVLATQAPMAAIPVIGGLLWRFRPTKEPRTVLLLDSVAAELRSGASLRNALVSGCESVSVDVTGRETIADITKSVSRALPDIGAEFALVVETAARTGGSAAEIFDEIADLASLQSEIAAEIRVATAPARVTAAVFLGAPLLFFLGRLATGSLQSLFGTGPQRIVALVGAAVFMTGFAGAVMVYRRST